MMLPSGLLGVLFHRLWSAHTRAFAEVLLPVPNEVSPHDCVDADVRKRFCEFAGYLRRKTIDRLSCRPAKQPFVVLPVDVQKPSIATTESQLVNLGFIRQLVRLQCQRRQPTVTANLLACRVPSLCFALLSKLVDRRFARLAARLLGRDRLQVKGRRGDLLSLVRFDPIVRTGMGTVIWTVRHRGAYRVQVDIHAAREQAGFIDDPLALEASFPKPAGALVLLVGHPRDRFGERSHKPRDIRQSVANLCKTFSCHGTAF